MTSSKKQPLIFNVRMDDGSIFKLPPAWEDVFYIKYGDNSRQLKMLKDALTLVTEKYYDHCAWPSKFDDMFAGDIPGYDPDSVSRYDYEEYYGEKWGEGQRGISDSNPPAMAQVAEAVLYQTMRSMLMQQALKDMDSDVKVITLEDLESGRHLPEP